MTVFRVTKGMNISLTAWANVCYLNLITTAKAAAISFHQIIVANSLFSVMIQWKNELKYNAIHALRGESNNLVLLFSYKYTVKLIFLQAQMAYTITIYIQPDYRICYNLIIIFNNYSHNNDNCSHMTTIAMATTAMTTATMTTATVQVDVFYLCVLRCVWCM